MSMLVQPNVSLSAAHSLLLDSLCNRLCLAPIIVLATVRNEKHMCTKAITHFGSVVPMSWSVQSQPLRRRYTARPTAHKIP